MHFYSITVVIIFKIFEGVKSNIIILMADCNNYLHTLSKTKLFFEFHHFWRKQRGGPGHLVPKKRTFLGRQKFLADYVAGGPKIWPGKK